MASKVNTKFVVILSAVLIVALIGVVGVAGYAMSNKGLRSIRQGDKLVAEGDYTNAEKAYGKAVNKDRTNLEWIEKWHGALSNIIPETQTQYEKLYGQHKSALLTMARLKPTDPEAQERYLAEENRYTRTLAGVSRESMARLIGEVEERIERLDPDDDATKRLLRYRGLALVDLMGVTKVEAERRELAKSDLERAIEADPGDTKSGYGLVRWYLMESLRHEDDRKPAEQQRMMDAHDAQLAGLIASHPDDPELRRHMLQITRQLRMIEMQKLGQSTTNLEQEFRGLAEDVLAAVESSMDDAEIIDRLMAVRITVQQAMRNTMSGEVAGLFERIAQRYPENAEALLQAGYALQAAGEYEKAIEYLEQLVTMPVKAVSLDGYMLQYQQDSGIGEQVDAYLSVWNEAEDGSGKDEMLSHAKTKLEELRTRLGSRGLRDVLIREAKIATMEGRFDAAVHKLTEFRGIAGDTLEAMSLLAHCLEQQSNHGEARLVLLDIIDRFGRYEEFLRRLAEVEISLTHIQPAYLLYTELSMLRPDVNAYKVRQSECASALATDKDFDFEVDEAAQDPTVTAMLDARRLLVQQDVDGAVEILEGLLDAHPEQTRIVQEYVRVCMAYGRTGAAISAVQRGLAANPDNEKLRNMQLQLEADDPLEGMEAVIKNSSESPLEEHLGLFQLFLNRGLGERSAVALREAIALAPEDPRVVEAEFLQALHDSDMDRARGVARRAGELNVDEVGGMLFQGRLYLAEQRFQEAAEAFKQALQQNPHNPSVRRLLGECQAQLGRLTEANTSLMRAHEARPRDIDTIKALTRVLVMQNRGREALVYASKGVSSDASDIEAVEMWLTLAGKYGEDEQQSQAEKIRRDRFQSDPSNIQNGAALITILVERESWDEAMAVIEGMRGAEGITEMSLVSMEAGVLSRRGKVEQGVALYRSFIEGLTDREEKQNALLSLGRYHETARQTDEALAAFREARAFQDPETLPADRMLGDSLFMSGARALETPESEDDEIGMERLREAAGAYESVLDINKSDTTVQKRLAETYLRLDNQAGVDRVLKMLEGVDRDDLQTLLLRANMAAQSGDKRRALEALGRAAELYPTEPIVFIQRAKLNMGDLGVKDGEDVDHSRDADVIADLKYVTEIRVSDTTAWTMLYQFYLSRRGPEEAVQQLREAAEKNPDSNVLRVMLIRNLFELGKQGDGPQQKRFREEAEQQAKNAADEHPDDLRWQLATGTVLRETRRFTEAVPILERALELSAAEEDELIGQEWLSTMLLDCYLQSSDTPEKAQVNPLLELLEPIAMENLSDHEDRFETLGEEWLSDQELETEAQGAILGLMLIARTKMFLGEDADAVALSGRALGACHSDAALSAAWFDQLRLLFDNADATVDFLEQMDALGKNRGKQVLTPYLRVIFEGERWKRGKSAEEVLAALDEIAPTLIHDGAKVQLHKQQSSIYYKLEDFGAAAEQLRQGITYNPNDAEMNNNLAYILVAHLKDFEAALPYAEVAVALNPSSSPTLDTLGYVYLKLGRLSDAIKLLDRAANNAGSNDERLIAKVHLGIARARDKDRGGARRELGEAEKILRDYPELGMEVLEDLETLRQEVE